MSDISIEIKNDAMLGRINDGVIATKLYSLEKKIEELEHQLQQKENIMKEAREYVNNLYIPEFKTGKRFVETTKLLEILDKEKE